MSSDPQSRRAAAVHIARRYLVLMEQRDLDGALRLVHADAVFIFPGGAVRKSLADIVAGSARRYQHVGKTIEACDAYIEDDDCAIVYVRGALHGRWPDGRDFADIRFIDRFEVRGGLIVRQDVWNDAGEFRT